MTHHEPDRAAESSTSSSLFDLRNIIALLFGVYGVVLLVIGLVKSSAEDNAKSGGDNLNLWTGVAMIVVAALFALWVRLRPLRPADTSDAEDVRPPGH